LRLRPVAARHLQLRCNIGQLFLDDARHVAPALIGFPLLGPDKLHIALGAVRRRRDF
jgi:hypothetical protein